MSRTTSSSFWIVVAVVLYHHVAPATALTRSFAQYQNFFPAWDGQLKEMLRDKDQCHESFQNYNNRSMTLPQVGYQVIGCIFENMPEYRKAELSAAAVIPGLAPSVLQLLSASYVDAVLLAFRRPGLALLLAMSNSGYLATAAAVANNAHLAYQLSVLAVCTFAPANDFLPAIWTAASVAIHLVGYAVVRLRIKVDTGDEMQVVGLRMSWSDRILNEVTPTFVGTALQAFYATIILSSLVFLSVRDSTIVVLRLMASTLAVRAILIYELTGFRTDMEGFGLSEKSEYTAVESLNVNN
ncbi:hypothetical protein FZEAL_7701 [Fusarium zealandicum]|uniref:Uncharacterized protein n=1 Tax=Fusarium zealandicum TaxID=1053134 RepID=A0A8H4UF83_9HYPO|nr:hypothetical protein FZEAL_7701 [Fusarium zealandicum]